MGVASTCRSSGKDPREGVSYTHSGDCLWAWWQGAGGRAAQSLREPAVYLLSTPGVPFSVIDMPLVTKSCYSGCPDISTLGLGPHVSIVCCQFSLCNTD